MPFCHNCGTQLNETAKFCPSCGAAYQGTPPSSKETVQTASTSIPASAPTSQAFQSTAPNPVQQNVVIMGTQKSVGVAFLLAFLFGPLGLLYATVIGGIVMFLLGFISFFILPLIGYILIHIGCIIWAVIAADQANKSMANKGSALINNQFQR